jgi:hypothetical protein
MYLLIFLAVTVAMWSIYLYSRGKPAVPLVDPSSTVAEAADVIMPGMGLAEKCELIRKKIVGYDFEAISKYAAGFQDPVDAIYAVYQHDLGGLGIHDEGLTVIWKILQEDDPAALRDVSPPRWAEVCKHTKKCCP